MELLIEHLGHGLMLSLMLSLPSVLIAAGIGLVVGILQAVTQVQEQTIAAAPKIIGVFAIILLGGGLMMNMLSDYVRESFHIAFNEIPQDGLFILPPLTSQSPGQLRARKFFELQSTEGPKSDKFKEYAAHWELPNAKDGSGTVLKTTKRSGPGNALGPAEKMALDKQKGR
jgi:flagellar biosynthesis protein FliQ